MNADRMARFVGGIDDFILDAPKTHKASAGDIDASIASIDADIVALDFNAAQARDEHGMWTSGGAAAKGAEAADTGKSVFGKAKPTKDANRASVKAGKASAAAVVSGTVGGHMAAARAHKKAALAHATAGGGPMGSIAHDAASTAHREAAAAHWAVAFQAPRSADAKGANIPLAKAGGGERPAPGTTKPEPPSAVSPAQQPNGAIDHAASAKFAAEIAGKPVEGLTRFGEGNTMNAVYTGRVGEHDVFVKPSSDLTDPPFVAKDAVALHQAFHKSADEIGCGHMVMPAALSDKGEFVTKSAGEGYKPFKEYMPAQVRSMMSDHDRVGAALLDHIHGNTDRHGGNALIDANGRSILIDHDLTHGREGEDPRKERSVFYPGGESGHYSGGGASYTSRQLTVDDLPPKMRDYVKDMSKMDGAAVGSRYGLSSKDGTEMVNRAKAVVRDGLDKAVSQKENVTWWS